MGAILFLGIVIFDAFLRSRILAVQCRFWRRQCRTQATRSIALDALVVAASLLDVVVDLGVVDFHCVPISFFRSRKCLWIVPTAVCIPAIRDSVFANVAVATRGSFAVCFEFSQSPRPWIGSVITAAGDFGASAVVVVVVAAAGGPL